MKVFQKIDEFMEFLIYLIYFGILVSPFVIGLLIIVLVYLGKWFPHWFPITFG